MGFFQVFIIVHMVLNRATHHISKNAVLETVTPNTDIAEVLESFIDAM